MRPLDKALAVGAEVDPFKSVALGIASSQQAAEGAQGTTAAQAEASAAAAVASAVAAAVEEAAPWAEPDATWEPALPLSWRRVVRPAPALPRPGADLGGCQDGIIGSVAAAVCVAVAATSWISASTAAAGAVLSGSDAALHAMALAFLAAVLSAVLVSGVLMWRASNLSVTRPWHNPAWTVVASACVLLSLALTLATGGTHASVAGWATSLVLPVVVFVVAVVARSHGADVFERDQRLKRIDFDTKLGMHSPR